ncbi:hypothetical protein NC653_040412 [Populus alba x Populus x berolinensis]|uniref:Uncharacterized protein n=1 Tax=Populus alba x Populus x berolinensis TaxID=444605 RepID=A0AAD6LDP7_9ROSI|nr:hypothetical protein NC653_040405 [Populus alba x Populus x berolinensis]KAJ6958776.1 hypothetical protein NC653_040412 [Populus alba x Populus x berolinensis]
MLGFLLRLICLEIFPIQSMLFSPMAHPLLNRFYMSHSLVSVNYVMSWGIMLLHAAKALCQSTRKGLKTFMKVLVVHLQTWWQMRNNNRIVRAFMLTLLLIPCPLKQPFLKSGDTRPLGINKLNLLHLPSLNKPQNLLFVLNIVRICLSYRLKGNI